MLLSRFSGRRPRRSVFVDIGPAGTFGNPAVGHPYRLPGSIGTDMRGGRRSATNAELVEAVNKEFETAGSKSSGAISSMPVPASTKPSPPTRSMLRMTAIFLP